MNQTNLQNLIEVFIMAMAALIVNGKLQKYWKLFKIKIKPHKADLKYQINQLTKELEIRMSERMGCLVCVNVWQFENGTQSMAGYVFEYFKLICHQSTRGFFSMQMYDRVRVEPYIEFVKQLNDVDSWVINSVNDERTSDAHKSLLNELGLKMAFDMKFNKDVYKGFVSVALAEYKPIEPADISLVREYTIAIYNRIKILAA